EASRPLLAGAARAVMLHVGKVPPIPATLREAGIPTHAIAIPRGNGPAGAALLAAAEAEGADLLVMGAYTHGAWREALLGGMTRHVLDHARIALLLRH
ncbi:MAG: universal stress protein, partial [Rhodospirillales bacterium]|nr:universal stress protein [Rhodospirillales bacterium]